MSLCLIKKSRNWQSKLFLKAQWHMVATTHYLMYRVYTVDMSRVIHFGLNKQHCICEYMESFRSLLSMEALINSVNCSLTGTLRNCALLSQTSSFLGIKSSRKQ